MCTVAQLAYNSIHIIIRVYINIFISSYISLWTLTIMNLDLLCPFGVTSIFQRCTLHPLSLLLSLCALLSCPRSLSYTSPHLFSDPTTMQWKSLQTTESEQFAYSLSKKFYHCLAHSYSWGHGQTGALIGPVKAQNTPLWSELTAIGWLFISNHIPVDPVASGYRFFLWLHMCCDSGPQTERYSWSKLQSTSAVLSVR